MTRPIDRRALLGRALGATAAALSGPARAQQSRAGALTGASGHTVKGSVAVDTADGRSVVRFSEDFVLDNAPDAYVSFGTRDGFAEGTDFEKMKSLSGAQSYTVPQGIDPGEHEAVWLWCRRFAVPLAVAPLN